MRRLPFALRPLAWPKFGWSSLRPAFSGGWLSGEWLSRESLSGERLGSNRSTTRRLGSVWPPLSQRDLPTGTLSGDAALAALWARGEDAALALLADCAASLCLYPAWERRDWGMPSAEGTLAAYGGEFWGGPHWAHLGALRQQSGRPNVLHLSSGLVFAVYQRPEQLTLVLGGTNTSHSDFQLHTLPSEARQFGADVLNVLGRLPRLFGVAAELTALVEAERGRSLPDLPLSLAGHSLGGGLVQYAAGLHGLRGVALSPTALGRATADALPGTADVLALSLDGDPIPLIGTKHLRARLVGEHLRLPLHPGVPPARHATSHGQIYLHLLAWLRERWPDLPSALPPAHAPAALRVVGTLPS